MPHDLGPVCPLRTLRLTVLVPIALGLALLAAFVFHALTLAREPLIDLRLFGKRCLGPSTSLLFLSGFAVYGAMLLMPLYLPSSCAARVPWWPVCCSSRREPACC